MSPKHFHMLERGTEDMERVLSKVVREDKTNIPDKVRELLGEFDGDLIVVNLPSGYRLGIKGCIFYREGQTNLYDLCNTLSAMSRASKHGAGISNLVSSLKRCTKQFVITNDRVYINIIPGRDENRHEVINSVVRQTSNIFGATRQTQYTFTYSS